MLKMDIPLSIINTLDCSQIIIDHGKRIKEWFGEDVVKYHRNFEEIINTLTNNGFIIDKILEPKPSKYAIENNPKYINQYDRPFFLFVRAIKNKQDYLINRNE